MRLSVLFAATLAPLAGASSCSCSVQDPHLTFPFGGVADFRGLDDTLFAFVSSPNTSLSFRTTDAVFKLGQLVVHGSFLTEANLVLRTARGRFFNLTYDTRSLNERQWGWKMVAGDCSRPGNRNPFFMGPHSERHCDDAFAWIDVSTVTVETGTWRFRLTGQPVYGRIDGPSHRLDFSAELRGDARSVDAHGILGQSFLSKRDGKLDVYPPRNRPGVFRTSAMAEGAIDGTAADYVVRSPYDTRFAYSRFDRALASPVATARGGVVARAEEYVADATGGSAERRRRLSEGTSCCPSPPRGPSPPTSPPVPPQFPNPSASGWRSERVAGATMGGFRTNERFGTQVRLTSDGSVLVAGAPTVQANGESGKVYVYDARTYALLQRIDSYYEVNASLCHSAGWDGTGASVDVDDAGDTIVVGHSHARACGSSLEDGAATVYQRAYSDGFDRWRIAETLVGDQDGYFGSSVALSGDGLTLAVAEPFYDWATSSKGRVVVYRRGSKAEGWALLTTIEGRADAWLGDTYSARETVSLSRNGTSVAVSSVDFSNEKGYVEVWSLEGGGLPSVLASGTHRLMSHVHSDKHTEYGNSIAISASGDCLVAGGFKYDNGFAPNKNWGYVDQWLRNSSGDGQFYLNSSRVGEKKQTKLGSSVAVAEDCSRIVVSSASSDNSKQSVAVYTVLDSDPEVSFRRSDVSAAFSTLGTIGHSVAVSSDGRVVAASSPETTHGALAGAGAVHVFFRY